MSTDDSTTYSDPDMPGMTFGRPPTRPSRPAGASEVVDDHDHDHDSDLDAAPTDGRDDRTIDVDSAEVDGADERTVDVGSAEVDGADERTVDAGSAELDGTDERTVDAGSAEVDGADERTVDAGSAEVDGTDERTIEPGPDAMDDAAPEPEPGFVTSVDDGVVAGPDRDAGEVDEPAAARGAVGSDGEPYLSPVQVADLQRRWGAVQAGFVDDPRRAVEGADDIVAEVVAALQAAIDDRRRELAEPWRDHADASTDALLVAFQSYRSVFERVLSS